VAQLFGRASAQNFSLFFDSPQPLVCSAVDGSLLVVIAMTRRFFWTALAAFALVACSPEQTKFNSIDITGADYAKGFTLTDHNNQTRSLSDFKGKVVVVFFGFTQCPDVCPTSLTELVEIKRLLGADGDKLQGVFVTVDPARDTTELLKAYMTNFDPSFVAFTPTPEQLAVVAKDYKIYYKKVEGKTPSSYSMDHSAGSYVYDTQGRLRLYTRYGMGAKALAQDVSALLKTTP
jgi:protein SCO1/2